MYLTKALMIPLLLFISGQSHANAKAQADLKSKNGAQAKGTVEFIEAPGALQVRYEITGLGKNSRHGFHIHEKGDCSSPDAMSAGKHYLEIAPSGGTAADSPQQHAGDFPQIKADSNGTAKGQFVVSNLTLNKNNPIKGRAIIVHSGPDNPNQKSPSRIACGVILLTKNE